MFIYTHTYVYSYTEMCVCVYMCIYTDTQKIVSYSSDLYIYMQIKI